MNFTWGDFWLRSGKWLETGWLITAGLVAFYIGVVEPRQMTKEIASSRTTGLGAVAGGSILPWRQRSFALPSRYETQAGGGGIARTDKIQVAAMTMNATP